MDNCTVMGWSLSGHRDPWLATWGFYEKADASREYSAEVTDEVLEGKLVVRVWRSSEGDDGGGSMVQTFKADPYLGKRVRFSAALRTNDVTGSAYLSIRVDGPGVGRVLVFDNTHNRPLISGTTPWARHACVVDVPEEATAIAIGSTLSGRGDLYWADVRFEIVDNSVVVTGVNAPALKQAPANLGFSGARGSQP